MDILRFKQNLIPLLTSSDGDGPFQFNRMAMRGMSSPRTAKILNFGAICASNGEFYLEIGTFSGYTLLSAAYQNNTLCIGVDDFSLKDVYKNAGSSEITNFVREALNRNILQFGGGNVQFVEADFRKIVIPDDKKGKLAVFFIDGTHDYENVDQAIRQFEPLLADDAVVVFDDASIRDIPKKIQELWQSGHYDLLFFGKHELNETEKTAHMGMPLNPVVANGLAVMHYHRN